MSEMGQERPIFDKYASGGAYHWKECDKRSKNFNPALVARYQVVVDQAREASNILEIGAGDGCLTARLAEFGARVIGVELDHIAVDLAAEALGDMDRCTIARADCYSLPFVDHSFDLVVMADVIEHLENPAMALAEAARVLSPGGMLVVTTPKWRPDRMWDIHHVREYTSIELRKTLEAFFSDVGMAYFWPLFWSNLYSTRLGWRALRMYARYFPNPFLKTGSGENAFGQILAICRVPESTPA